MITLGAHFLDDSYKIGSFRTSLIALMHKYALSICTFPIRSIGRLHVSCCTLDAVRKMLDVGCWVFDVGGLALAVDVGKAQRL